MEYKKRIAPIAHRDIEGIKNYIAKDKPSVAVKVANKIYFSFNTLQQNPHIGGSIKERFDIETDFFYWVVAPYMVFYKIEDSFVGIYRVLDGRSDYLVTLGVKQG